MHYSLHPYVTQTRSLVRSKENKRKSAKIGAKNINVNILNTEKAIPLSLFNLCGMYQNNYSAWCR